jgi:aldehyde:ferredoxin oxidoreductase
MEVWRINLHERSFSREPTPAAWQRLGGRGLLARILLDEVPPTCDPLGSRNKLIFAPGLLVGHKLSSCDRISAGAKSPLTGGVKESNAGGSTGLQLTYLGIKALIFEGQPSGEDWLILRLDGQGVHFEPAGDVVGKGVYASAEALRRRYGTRAAIALIGPAGEMRLTAAGIVNLDKEGVPSRINARGGLGAVMGCKRIKAIVIDGSQGKSPPLHDEKAFRAAQKEFTKALMAHPQTAIYRDFSTAGIVHMCNMFGALPTRNFSQGQFEHSESISGENLRSILLERGGKADPSHACMIGCGIRCSNVYADQNGEVIVSPIEYETIGLMGSNLGIGNLDEIARLNYKVNDLGLDSIDTGAALGVVAEAGLMKFGDAESAHRLLDEVVKGSPLGRLIGCGAAVAGKALGVRRVPAVKGQAISAYDPRAIKGTGVTYATSPQGADHTAGLTIRAKINHLDPKGQVEVSRTAQINMAGYDTLGACIFAGFGFAAAPHTIRDLLNARYGWEVDETILQQLGKETLKLEREFNRRAGFTPADDRLPEWMSEEALPPNQCVFDVDEREMDELFNW